MNNKTEISSNYFTAGELASMFGISKQSLLYYDKIHLLSPDFISENGYRHYSITQYLDLEIIVNLRALDIPINDIKDYLQNRGQKQLEDIFDRKARYCEEIIKENERIRNALSIIIGKLWEERPEQRNQVLIRSCSPRYIKVSPLTPRDNGKDRIVLFARASHKTMHNRCLLEKQQGWIIRQEDFFSGHCSNESTGYFFFLAGPVKNHHLDSMDAADNDTERIPDSKRQQEARLQKKKFFITTLPESLYCEMTFDGTFFNKADEISKVILVQLKKYKLRPEGDVYVLPVRNHWFTTSPENYVTKVFFQVVN